MVDIELSKVADAESIRSVLTAAFATEIEAELVAVLREDGDLRADCSVVARDDGIVGYAAVSDVEVPAAPQAVLTVLGPVAVVPERQGEGIGSDLVRSALTQCVRAGCAGVVLEGDPAFYNRFGFESADAYGLRSDLNPPPGTFQVWPARPESLDGVEGVVVHPAPFHALD